MTHAPAITLSAMQRQLVDLSNERYEKERRLNRLSLEMRYGALGSMVIEGLMTLEEIMSGLVSDIKWLCEREGIFRHQIAELTTPNQ